MKGSLHRLIRVKHNSANGIVDQTNGQAKTQAPLFRFALFSSLQAALQPMEFGLRHAALETEQQPVVMGSGIIYAFVINHQGLGQRTDFQQSIPIAARTRQARNLQAEHCPNVPQTHFSYQPLEAIAANGRCARLSLILVDHLDTSRRPSQILGSLDEIILPGRTAGIFSNLEQRGLPHINDSEPIKMVRTDFLRRWSVQHRLPPFRHTRFQGESPYSTLIEQADQSHKYAARGREQATPVQGLLAPHERVGVRTCANLRGLAHSTGNTDTAIISHDLLEAGGAFVVAKPIGQFARALQSRAKAFLLDQKRRQIVLRNPSDSLLWLRDSHQTCE